MSKVRDSRAYVKHIDTSCVLFWTPQELRGSDATHEDYSDGGNDGTRGGNTLYDLTVTAGDGYWVNSREKSLEGGFYFDGSTTYATRAGFQPFHSKDAFSCEIWFRKDDTSSNAYIVMQLTDGSNYFTINPNGSGNVVVDLKAGGTLVRVTAGTYTAGTLHHVVARWDKDDNSGKLTVELDGVSTDSSTGYTSTTANATDMKIGEYSGTFYKGVIYRVQIWGSKLTSQNVSDLYNGVYSTVGTPIALYRFGQGEDTTFYDTRTVRDGRYGYALDFDGNLDINIPLAII